MMMLCCAARSESSRDFPSARWSNIFETTSDVSPSGTDHNAATTDSAHVWCVSQSGGQGSHQLTSMARAGALAVVPDGAEIGPGDPVDIIVLD